MDIVNTVNIETANDLVRPITYEDLIQFAGQTLDDIEFQNQHNKNQLSTLTKYLEYIGLGKSDVVDTELHTAFQRYLSDFLNYEETEGRTSNLRRQKSHLNFWRNAYKQMVSSEQGIVSFQEKLVHLFEENKREHPDMDQDAVSKAVGMARTTFNQWISGRRLPGPKTYKHVPELEKVFKAPAGTLQTLLPEYRSKNTFKDRYNESEYAQRLSVMLKDQYRLKDTPENLKQEWLDFLNYKVSVVPPMGLKRDRNWRTKPKERVPQRAPKGHEFCYEAQSGELCPSALMWWIHLRAFYGWLLNYRKPALKPEQLSLVHLADPDLLFPYLEFRKGKSGDYNGSTDFMLIRSTSMTHAEFGYLRQQPAFGQKMLNPVPADQWDAWCDLVYERVNTFRKELRKGKHVKKSRDPSVALHDYLNKQHPMDALFLLIERMESERDLLSPKPNALDAIFMRNILLIKMLTVNPLRAAMYQVMTYRNNGSGNLYKNKETGAWGLKFSPEDFKNHRGAANKPYHIVLPESLWADIDSYINEYRPFLLGADTTDYVFRPLRRNNERLEKDPWQVLDQAVFKITANYLHEYPPIRPHAFRHIIATEYLKNEPNGFQVVANILHDKLETVLNEYAHLQVADGYAHWLTYYGEQSDRFDKEAA